MLTLMATATMALAADLGVQLEEVGRSARRYDGGELRVAAVRGERVMLEAEDGACEVDVSGNSPPVCHLPTEASSIAAAWATVQRDSFVAEVERVLAWGDGPTLGPSWAARRILGPACPDDLCVGDVILPEMLSSYPAVRAPSRFGDVAVNASGTALYVTLDPSHAVVFRRGAEPAVVMTWRLERDGGFDFHRLISGRASPADPGVLEALIAVTGVGYVAEPALIGFDLPAEPSDATRREERRRARRTHREDS